MAQAPARADPPCAPGLRPIEGQLGYQPRGGDLCEGIYEAPTSAAFEVLSFARVPEPDSDLAGSIGVLLPLIPEGPGSDVRIQVRALREKTYYQLDAHGRSATTVSWSTGTVLDKKGLSMTDLGYLGWVSGEGENVFVPLTVFQQVPTVRAQDAPLTLVVRSPLRFEWVKWRIHSPMTRGTAEAGWRELDGTFPPGEPLELIIPPGLQGVMTVDVHGQPADRDIPERITLHVRL
ncbi:hypothetical protein [Pyxidicoccus sp. MSG2]|uniref:hypothetical protein n=1 Tax=Pyxidicoccus sp. MSG2 TaxID=2996790 RepID=UPI002270ACC5|nr:hypothetical protein [Pyxidicoccus sp. MSG2]MCY1019903.1 hypothetical protein [Pyxidicoccus sp. MSG2]